MQRPDQYTYQVSVYLPSISILIIILSQGLLDLDGRNSQKYLHQTWANF